MIYYTFFLPWRLTIISCLIGQYQLFTGSDISTMYGKRLLVYYNFLTFSKQSLLCEYMASFAVLELRELRHLTLKRHHKHIGRIFTLVGHSNIFKYCKPIFFRDDFISRFNWGKTGSWRLIFTRTPYSTPCCYYESWFAAKNFRDDLALAIFSPPRINFGLQYLESFL